MKTLEFKLSPTTTQSESIDKWLEKLPWIWNTGLSILEEEQQRQWREKHGKPLPDCLKLKSKNGKFVGCGVKKTTQGYKYCQVRSNRDVQNLKFLFLSGLGKIRVKRLRDRLTEGTKYGSAFILKEPSGYYLQVMVDINENS